MSICVQSESCLGCWCPTYQGRGGLVLHDWSPYRNDGDFVNMSGANWVDNRGSAIDLDGVSDHIKFGKILRFEYDMPFSVSMWIRPDVLGASNRMFIGNAINSGTYRGWKLRHLTSGTIEFSLRSTLSSNELNVSSSSTITTGTWQFIAATYDGSTNASGAKIYIGDVDATGTATSDTLSATIDPDSELYVGRRFGVTKEFDGLFDDIRAFDHAITPSEVSQLYAGGHGRGLGICRPIFIPQSSFQPAWAAQSTTVAGVAAGA